MQNPESISEILRVCQFIREKIINGEYPAGYRLVEADIAAHFKISRTPVRLAIERLVSEGLVIHERNKGAIVRRLSIEDLVGLLTVRMVNEGLAARLASQNVTRENTVELAGLVTKMDLAVENNDRTAYYDLAARMHQYIFYMADNEFLVDLLTRIYALTRGYHIEVLYLPERIASSCAEHKAIVNAILSENGDLAEQKMREHIAIILDFYNNEENRKMIYSLSQFGW